MLVFKLCLAILFRYKGDTKLVQSDRILLEKNETVHSLTIKQVVRKEAGQYTVKAVNSVGTASSSATLKVKGKVVEFDRQANSYCHHHAVSFLHPHHWGLIPTMFT